MINHKKFVSVAKDSPCSTTLELAGPTVSSDGSEDLSAGIEGYPRKVPRGDAVGDSGSVISTLHYDYNL